MSKLKLLRKANGTAEVKPPRNRTLPVAEVMADMKRIEFETVSNGRQVAAEREARKEAVFAKKCELLPVTQLCCPRWMMMCRKLHRLPLLKGEDRVKLAGYAKRYSKDRGDFLRYMDWCLDHWRMVVESRLGWMRDKPLIPSVPIFVRWSQHFEHLWLHKEEADALAEMTERDRIIARALKTGKSYDAAEREADEKMGLVYQREAVEKEKQAVIKERALLAQEAHRTATITRVQGSRERAATLLKTTKTTKPLAGGLNGWKDADE